MLLGRPGPLLRRLSALVADRSASVALIAAAAMPVIVGAVGLGTEVSYWFMTKRAMQHAADSAALAASMSGTANFKAEARAVAAQYGFVDGANNVSVAVPDPGRCPVADLTGDGTCYTVNITGSVPLYLTRVLGFNGDMRVNGQGQKRVAATSTASRAVAYCILALDTVATDDAILANGTPKTDLGGCNVMSNASVRCNGHGLGAGVVNASSSSDPNCGAVANSSVQRVADPYRKLAAHIPPISQPCSRPRTWTGAISDLDPVTIVCGDLKLTGNVVITNPTVLVIRNGNLVLGDNKSSYRLAGSALTVVFTDGAPGGDSHIPTHGGILDIAAPTVGPWAGIALYQDPKLTSGVDLSYSGNSPTWNITGVVYLPNSKVTLSGAVNKSGSGESCVVLVVHQIRINGGGRMLSNAGCPAAGVPTPLTRGKLLG